MKSNRKFTILHRNEIFYTLVVIMCVLGVYVANIVEHQYAIIAGGITGLAILYLIYLVFVAPKNITSKPIELKDLEFPRDIKYLFIGFFWTMIMFWAAGQIINLAQYLLHGIIGM